MNKVSKIIITLALVIAVSVVVVMKQNDKKTASSSAAKSSTPSVAAVATEKISAAEKTITEKITDDSKSTPIVKSLPKLLDLGADKCVPCKMMFPVLDELKAEHVGKLDVEFIDVWKNPTEARKYGVKIIPTQIFYDASGKELFRHEGFFSKEDILAKWKTFGIEL